MPFYRINVGFRIDNSTIAKIRSSGISGDIYSVPVRIVGGGSSDTNTILNIEAENDTVAKEWATALRSALTTVLQYSPQVVENPDPDEPPLDIWTRVGQWTKSVGSATTSIGSLPGAPKGIIVWGSGLSGAAFGTYNEAGGVVMGFSNGTDSRDYAYAVQDNVTPTNANRSLSNKAFHLIDPTGDHSTHVKENCTISFGATSFAMNWNATTLGTVGHYFVFGGDEIGIVEIKDFNTDTTSTGSHSYTGLTELYHDFAIFFAPNFAATTLPLSTTVSASGALHSISVHASQSSDEKSWSTNIKSTDNLATADTFRLQRTGILFDTMAHDSVFRQMEGEWVHWTDNGFDINWVDSPDATDRWFTGMFVKGGKWDAGAIYQPTSTGEVTKLVHPKSSLVQGIMGFSVGVSGNMTSTYGIPTAKMTIGAQDLSGNKGCLSYSGEWGVNPSREATIMVTDKFIKQIDAAATAASSSTQADGIISDMATQGEFTLNYTTVADAFTRQTVWFTLSA